MKDIVQICVEEEIQTVLEARVSSKEQLKRDLERTDFGEQDSMFKQAAKLIQDKTLKTDKSGGMYFTIKDIIHVLNALKDDKDFMAHIKTAQQLADAAIQVCNDVIEIANAFVKNERMETGYRSQLAYEVENRDELIKAIKTTLKAIYALTKKRIKLESTDEAQTLTIRKVMNYIITKAASIKQDMESIAHDLNSNSPKVKALATANMKNLEAQFGKNPADKLNKAFDLVKRYAGSSSLTWPSLKIKIESGDEYKSLFKYLDAYAQGKDKGHADNLIAQYKNKAKAEIRRKMIVNSDFRKKLKEAVHAKGIDVKFGADQSIKELQKVAKKLMKDNPEYVAELKKEGIKETAIDEIVGLLSTFIKYGKYDVKVE